MAKTDSTYWTEQRFQVAVGIAAGVFGLLLLIIGFDHELYVPANPPKPVSRAGSAAEFSASVDRNPAAYANYVRSDAREYGAPIPTIETMSRHFPHRFDDSTYTLEPGADDTSTIESSGLRIRVAVQDQKRSHKRMMVLQIENTTDRPLAYRIQTRPSRGTQACHQKEDLPHNAIAVAAGDVEMRSECIYRKGWKLQVTRVDTVALPPLGYHYVSRLPPAQAGLERRVVRGHEPPAGKACQLVLPAAVMRGLEQEPAMWRSLVDFYARHRCETYAFSASYEAPGEGETVALPAVKEQP